MLVSTTSGDPYGFNPDSSATHRIGVRLLEGDCAAVSDAFAFAGGNAARPQQQCAKVGL